MDHSRESEHTAASASCLYGCPTNKAQTGKTCNLTTQLLQGRVASCSRWEPELAT